jgi:N-acetylneuraminic acid mutarotase
VDDVTSDGDTLTLTAPSRTIDAKVPRRAELPLVVASRANADIRLEVRALDRRTTAATVDRGAVVFADAAPDTDVVHAFTAGGVEELRVVRAAQGPVVVRYELRLGPGVAGVRVREGRIEALDAAGVVRLDTAPMFAVDAHDRRRDMTLAIERSGDRAFVTATLDSSGLELPIVIDPVWGPGGSMAFPRAAHTATVLATGEVLAVGGEVGSGPTRTSSAELYSPTTNTWTSVGSMTTARAHHAAVRLASGDVLVVSGQTTAGTPTCEIYSVASKTWHAAASLPVAAGRYAAIAQTLPSGKVLFAGGRVTTTGQTAESFLYDATADSWAAASSMPSTLSDHVSVLLASGKVLVAGGSGPSTYSKATYLFDGTTWTSAANMTGVRANHTLTLLPSGKVLAVGGIGAAGTSNTTEIYDPTANTWTAGAATAAPRYGHVAALLPGGKVAITSLYSAELDDPVAGTSTLIAAPSTTHSGGVAVTLGSGKVLAVGGTDSVTPSGAELLAAIDIPYACASDAECIGGHCVDGVCCNTACTGQCQACDVAGSVGTCTTVASGPVHGSRPSCAPYLCSAGACSTTCTTKTDCASGNYCDASKHCVAEKSNGVACGATTECKSGFCVDGVCCNAACNGQCEACDLGSAIGTCTAVSGAPHGSRTACAAGTGATCNAQKCDGADRTACHFPSIATTCSANASAGGVETHASTCDGSGACTDVPKSCGAFSCGPTACKTTCTSKSDCIAGYSCVGGACTPSVDLGKPCSDPAACGDLFCVDGTCCGTSSCATGESCGLPGKLGTCAKKNGTACTSDPECGSGHCADGVCCDAACKGQCEACDVVAGQCQPVSGKPHGDRASCSDGGGDVCAGRQCDGTKDRNTCAGYVSDTSVPCKAASCAVDQYTGTSTCNAAGSCLTPVTSSCVPYRCDDMGCLSSCTSDAQCSATFVCKGNKCISAEGATCSDDKSSSIAKDGTPTSCSPYLCQSDGNCAKACGTTEDCAAGFLCDNGFCAPVPPETDSGGGCALATRAPRTRTLELFGCVLALALVGRSRRAKSGRP